MREWNNDQKTFAKEYHDYIVSPTWGAKRMEAFALYGRQCAACGKNRMLHVHHKSYLNLYNEPLSDLCVLCKRCHVDLHKRFDRTKSKDLPRFTERYIENKKYGVTKKRQKRLYVHGKLQKDKSLRLSTGRSCVDEDYLLDY